MLAILKQNKISMEILLFPLMNQNWKLQALEVYKLKYQYNYFVCGIDKPNNKKEILKLSGLLRQNKQKIE